MVTSLRPLVLFSFPAALLLTGVASPADPPPTASDPQILARGPVHEAFARPAETPAAAPIIAKEPPAPIKEVPPDQKPDMQGVEWIPGYWAYDDDKKDYIWVSGTWRVPPPGRQWVPGAWKKATGGWQWQQGFWGPTDPGDVKPFDSVPPASMEIGASSPPPTADSYYTPGQWVFQNGEWVWQPGMWATNSGDMVYVPPQYLPNQGGSMYVPGYWDYPLQNRGMLFAPVAFGGQPWLGNSGWSYQPGYSVGLSGLLGSLFVRPGLGSYYFGNYFNNSYRGLGYQPWTAFARRGYDPLFNYYSWANRGTPAWTNNLATLYASRLNGSIPAPGITLAQQLRTASAFNGGITTLHTTNFGRNLSVNSVNSLRTVHPLAHQQHVRLVNATSADLAVRSNFATRQNFTHPVVPAVRINHGVPVQNFSLPQARITSPRLQINHGVPVQSPAVRPAAHIVPRVAAPRVQHAAPRVQAFRPAPAMHVGGRIGGGRIGGGHIGGHGGGHRR